MSPRDSAMTAPGAITTPFGVESTAAEVAAGVDLSGKRAVVTGAASGIGVETARALAGAGAGVTLAVRDLDAGARVAADIIATTGNADVAAAQLELTDRASIDVFTESWQGPLHLLVNNAGVMAIQDLQLTPEGYEMQFATNHLGHFALALGLHDALAADGHARIVSVSSSAHQYSPVIFEDIHFRFRPYEPFIAYGQSKTANVLFAVEATRRWAEDGITVNALMPGGIATNLQRHVDPEDLARIRARSGVELREKNVEQGAATSVLLAVSSLLEGVGGRYFEDCREAEVLHRRGANPRYGVAWFALDPVVAERLWRESLQLLGR